MNTFEVLPEDAVLTQLEQGATLVTVNRRLAGYCLGRYADFCQQRGFSVWETPDVLPYGTWLERCWQQISAFWPQSGSRPPQLLSSHQQHLIWTQVLADSESGKTLLHPEATARTVDDARRLCRQWHLPTADKTQWTGTDPAAFYAWSADLDRRLRAQNWLDRHAVADAVCKALLNDNLVAPEVMIFYGFDDMAPQQTDLIEALQARGCRVVMQAFPDRGGKAVRCGFADRQAETEAAARWVRHRLRQFSDRRIGVVVPGLADYRQALVRAFDDVLHPAAVLSPQEPESRAYNISLGRPLFDYPVVQTAFDLLDMAAEPPDISRWTGLLLSPFLAGAERERSARAALDAWLRKNGEVSVSAGRMLQWIQRFSRKGGQGRCPILYQHLQEFLQVFRQLPKKQPPGLWSRDFSFMLDTLGWPGERSLTSHEYQTVSAWHEALSRFAALADVSADLGFAEAMAMVKGIVDQTPFQPEGGDAAVQVMGMLEAGGEAFDDLWIMGIDQSAWPPPPQPNPFIPHHLQHRLNLPHATPARELAYSRQLTRRLLAAADNVVVSYPLADGDSQCLPSPLIAHLPEIDPEDFDGGDFVDFCRIIADAAAIEALKDDCAPALSVPEDVAGGTGVVKAQAACPFQAFARYRLGADPLEIPAPGLNAAERGTMAHYALELVWQRLKDHDRLTGKTPGQLDMIVSEAVTAAIRDMAGRKPETFTQRFTAMETDRLHELVREWLEVDKQRLPFEVAACEQQMTVGIAGLRFTTYADRIDRLADGRLVIVDYKTGEPKARDWFFERIAEPQLPLYSVAMREPLAGVFFGQVRKGDMKYIGVADDEGIVPGGKSVADAGGDLADYGSIAEIVADWHYRLEALGRELQQGRAAVAPASVRTSCRYCHLAPVCRIGEYDFLPHDEASVNEVPNDPADP